MEYQIGGELPPDARASDSLWSALLQAPPGGADITTAEAQAIKASMKEQGQQGAWVDMAVLTSLVAVLEQAAAPLTPLPAVGVVPGPLPAAATQPRRVAAILSVCHSLVKAGLGSEMRYLKLPLHVLGCIRRWTPSGAAPADDPSPGAAVLAAAGAVLSALLQEGPTAPDILARGTPGGSAALMNILLSAAHSGPAGLQAMLGPLFALVAPGSVVDWAVRKIIADQPLLSAVVESARLRQRLPESPSCGSWCPALELLMSIVQDRQPSIAAVVLRLPGLPAAALAILEEAAAALADSSASGEDSADEDLAAGWRMDLNASCVLLASLTEEKRADGPAAAEASAMDILAAASDAALARLISLAPFQLRSATAMMAASAVFRLVSFPKAHKQLLARTAPPALVTAAAGALQHPDLGPLPVVEVDFDTQKVIQYRQHCLSRALRALAFSCQESPAVQEALQQALPRFTPPHLIQRLIHSIYEEVEGGQAVDAMFQLQYILAPVAQACRAAGGSVLQPMRVLPPALAAALQEAVRTNSPREMRASQDVVSLVQAVDTVVEEAQASEGPVPWAPNTLDGLLRAMPRAQRWLEAWSSPTGGSRGMGGQLAAHAAGVVQKVESLSARLREQQQQQQASPAAAGGSGGPPAAAAAVANACGGCGATSGPQGARLKVCGCCRGVRYCSDACAKAAWPSHKAACKAAQQAAAVAAAAAASGSKE